MRNSPAHSATFRVAVTDLDDTLLDHEGAVSARSVAAIEAWLDSGRRFVVATGRPPRSIGDHLPPSLHQVPWVCYNGAEIRLGGESIYRRYIPEKGVESLIHRILDSMPEAIVGIEVDDMMWLNRPRPSAAALSPHHRVVDLRSMAHKATAKVLLFADSLDALRELLDPLPDCVRLMPSGRYPFMQLMEAEADKAVALRHLLQMWGESMSGVVAFGDDINDVDLLREAGMGVAVANAYAPVLAAANRLTASNCEDGVARVLEELLGSAKG